MLQKIFYGKLDSYFSGDNLVINILSKRDVSLHLHIQKEHLVFDITWIKSFLLDGHFLQLVRSCKIINDKILY